MTVALTVGLLTFGAFYLFSKRELLRVILGMVLLGHAANLAIIAMAGLTAWTGLFGHGQLQAGQLIGTGLGLEPIKLLVEAFADLLDDHIAVPVAVAHLADDRQ